jgi:hypothetical protein
MYAEVMFAGRCLFVLWQVSLLIVTLSRVLVVVSGKEQLTYASPATCT